MFSSVLLESRRMTLEDQLKSALAKLCQQNGSVEAVADKAGVSADNLKQILAGTKLPSGQPRGIGPTVRRKLETAYPGWSLPGAESVKSDTGVAHPMILGKFTVPLTISWGELMTVDLPEVFNVVLNDNAMAPRAPAGAQVEFTRGLEPKPGDGVLVKDRAGNHYFREYKSSRVGVWSAHAINPAYDPPLDPTADGLVVVAVLTGMSTRWSS